MTMTTEELKAKLDAHKLWLETRASNEVKGARLDLRGADLTAANLTAANLTDADLRGAYLTAANLTCANLHGANLAGAVLTDADLTRADLTDADLTDANLHGANLHGANLAGAVLTDADLTRADLTYAILTRAYLTNADLDHSAWPLWCGSLRAKIDKRLAAQLMYHAMRAMSSCKDDASVAAVLASPECVALANQFHRVNECGPLEVLGNGGEAGEVGK